MIYTFFDLNGKPLTINSTTSNYVLQQNEIEGDQRNFYLFENTLYPKTEYTLPEVINNFLDFGTLLPGDFICVNGDTYANDFNIIEFTEPGEYTISISFVRYFEKEFTVIVP